MGWMIWAVLLFGCQQESSTRVPADVCDRLDPGTLSAGSPAWAGIQGALLASRFETLEELKEVVKFAYYPPQGQGVRVPREDSMVSLTHCSNGRIVEAILAWGVDEHDFFEAYAGGMGEKMVLGMKSPFSVANRTLLQRIFILSRWRQDYFGEGDPAFFDLACLVPRDSSEKGYLNTFNHVTAQAFITSLYSEELADFVADVHERRAMPELISGVFRPEQLTDPNTNAVDNYVDIVNNEWGQELGKTLREKYGIHAEMPWTEELLRDYLNDIQRYYAWGLRIGFEPFRAQDTVVVRFTRKLNFVREQFPR